MTVSCQGSRFATAIILLFAATSAFAQSHAVPSSGPAENGSPAWFLQGSFPDPEGSASVSADGKVTILPKGNRQQLTVIEGVPNCSHSPVCGNRMTNGIVGPQQGEDDKFSTRRMEANHGVHLHVSL